MKQSYYGNQVSQSRNSICNASRVSYQDYIANRQSNSKSVGLVCYNCVNQGMSQQKKQEELKRKEEEKIEYKDLTKSIVKQQNDEEMMNIQKRLKEREFLQTSYKESIKIIEQKRNQEKSEKKKLAEQIKQSDKLQQEGIQKQIEAEIQKKRIFMQNLNEQLKNKPIKTEENTTQDWFQIGDEEKTEQIIHQKKLIERNLLKQQRDESVRRRESHLFQQEDIKAKERHQVDYQVQLEQELKKASIIKKKQIEKEYKKELQQSIVERNERKVFYTFIQRHERIKTAEDFRKSCTKNDQENIIRENYEQQMEEEKRKIYLANLNQQNSYLKELKEKEKSQNRQINQKLCESNKKYEFLRKELKKSITKSCQKCYKDYDIKCLSKSRLF